MSDYNPASHGFGSPERTKEFDDAARAKARGVPRVRVWTDERIAEFIDELLDVYKKILTEDDKVEKENSRKLKVEMIRDLNVMVRRLLDFKEAYYPPVQRNVNINIDMTANAVIERLKLWKRKKEVVVILENGQEKKERQEENTEENSS